MSKTLGPSVFGARSAKELLLKVERCNKAAVAEMGELDLHAVADLIERCLREPRGRDGLLLALAEFIATAVNGDPIDIHDWTPLAYFDAYSKAGEHLPVKRF
jgi:hypothetical protein